MQQTFTSNEVIALTGITPASSSGGTSAASLFLRGKGTSASIRSTTWPRWPSSASCAQRGFSLQKIRLVVRFLQKELGKRLVETVTAASEYHLLTDGRHIYLEDSARAVVDLLKNARQPMLSVCLSDTIQRVLHPLERKKVARRRQGEPALGRRRGGRRYPGLWPRRTRRLRWFERSGPEKRNGSVRQVSVRRHKAS